MKTQRRISSVMRTAGTFVLAVILTVCAAALPARSAEAKTKKQNLRVKSCVQYVKVGEDRWVKTGYSWSFTYDKHGNLTSVATNYGTASDQKTRAKISYKYKRNKKASSRIKTNGWYSAGKIVNKYNSSGQRIRAVIGDDSYAFAYRKGFVSKSTERCGGRIVNTITYQIKTRSRGLLKRVISHSSSGSRTTYYFNKKGLVKSRIRPGDKRFFKYKYRKNGTVKKVTYTAANGWKYKIIFNYDKKTATKKKYAALINYVLVGSITMPETSAWLMPLE